MRTSLCVNTKLTYKFKKKVVGCNKVTYGQVSSRYSVLGAFPVSAFKFSPVCWDSVRKARILLIFYPSPRNATLTNHDFKNTVKGVAT